MSELERIYLCQRLDRLNGLAATFEKRATAARGPYAQTLLIRADKYRMCANRIRAYLRTVSDREGHFPTGVVPNISTHRPTS